MSRETSRQWTRRGFLGASSAAALGGLLFGTAACGGSDGAGSSGGGKGDIKWWDHYNALQNLHKKMLADWSQKSGTKTQYTFYQGKKMAEATQLAKQSGQMPDVISLSPSIGIPLPSLVKDGWFQPLELSEEALGRLPKEDLIDGVHLFDGKLYTFPIFNSRWHSAGLFINKKVYEKAGLDPASPPNTWDDFRAACRTVRQKVGGQTFGYMDTEAGPAKIGSLAQAAGFAGTWEGQLFSTGEYKLHDDAWINTIEFIQSLAKDKLLYPGSNTTMKADVARGRWAAGGAAFFFDGPWGPGLVAQNFKQFANDIAVGQILISDANAKRTTYTGPGAGAFFIPAASKQAETSNELLGEFTKKEYYTALAQSMDQPPLDLAALDSADGVDPNYKQNIEWCAEQVFMQPMPIVRKAEVYKVEAERKPVTPDFRAVVTGLYTGQVKDIRKALTELSDKLNKDLDQAIKAAKAKGADVSREDFAFPDWQPGKDYEYKK